MIIGFLDIFRLNSTHAFQFIKFEYLLGFSRSHVFLFMNYEGLLGGFFFRDYQCSLSVFYIV